MPLASTQTLTSHKRRAAANPSNPWPWAPDGEIAQGPGRFDGWGFADFWALCAENAGMREHWKMRTINACSYQPRRRDYCMLGVDGTISISLSLSLSLFFPFLRPRGKLEQGPPGISHVQESGYAYHELFFFPMLLFLLCWHTDWYSISTRAATLPSPKTVGASN